MTDPRCIGVYDGAREDFPSCLLGGVCNPKVYHAGETVPVAVTPVTPQVDSRRTLAGLPRIPLHCRHHSSDPMLEVQTLSWFVVAALLLIVTPGPAVLCIVARTPLH